MGNRTADATMSSTADAEYANQRSGERPTASTSPTRVRSGTHHGDGLARASARCAITQPAKIRVGDREPPPIDRGGRRDGPRPAPGPGAHPGPTAGGGPRGTP